MKTYEYRVDNDFSDGVVVIRIHNEIVESSISTTFSGILNNESENVIQFKFAESLTSSEKTTLDNLVTNHSADPWRSGDEVWLEIMDYMENTAEWSETKMNDVISKYVMFEKNVRAREFNKADTILSEAESIDIISTEADDIRDILGV